MKTIGIQIKGAEAIVVVLHKDDKGIISMTNESCKIKIDVPLSSIQVKQFKDQINTLFDTIGADNIGIMARNASGRGSMSPSPISFKLEGIIQLYNSLEVEIIWKQSINAYFKKNTKTLSANNKYQEDAFDIAYYLISTKINKHD